MKSTQLSWTEFAETGSKGASGSTDKLQDNRVGIDQHVMQALQDSCDATTRLTLSVKKCGQELMAATTVARTGEDMVAHGVVVCRNLVEPITAIECLLLKPKDRIGHGDAMTALKAAACPFEELENFQKELQSLHKMYVQEVYHILGIPGILNSPV